MNPRNYLLCTAAILFAITYINYRRRLPSATAFRLGHDAEQLRGRATTEALKEAQKQTIIAAQAIATAREATMELDKVKFSFLRMNVMELFRTSNGTIIACQTVWTFQITVRFFMTFDDARD